MTVIALCMDEREVVEMQRLEKEGLTIRAIQEKRSRQFLRGLSALGTSLPFQVAFGAVPRLRREVAACLANEHFDVLHVEALRTLGALPGTVSIPTIWDEVDCMSQSYEQGARFGATAMLRLIGQTEAERIRAFERLQLRRFSQILVASERDRQALLSLATQSSDRTRRHPLADITVLPNGIDQSYFHPYDGPRQPGRLVFSGTMNFHANIAALFTLVEEIMPRIWEQRPDARLSIVGSNPSARIRRLAHDPRITVTGFVSDMRSYIAEAQVAVSPLPYATGIQNKILEAMALGTPVVTSSSSSAGLQAIPDRDLLVADNPQAFAASVLKLMDDQILWKRLSESGQAYISNYHNWDTIVEQLSSVYYRVIDTSAYVDAQVLLR